MGLNSRTKVDLYPFPCQYFMAKICNSADKYNFEVPVNEVILTDYPYSSNCDCGFPELLTVLLSKHFPMCVL